ncbi:MAG: hypothetical protein MZV70_29140 [Desulfobacterales bacterium]|nr:hypothetical protein [Desulfobacterales bacterium]
MPSAYQHIVDHKAIQQYLEKADPETIAREVYGKWTARGSTLPIPQAVLEFNRLRASEQDVLPEREGAPGATYVLGCDFGFSGADETSVAVLKRLYKVSGYV